MVDYYEKYIKYKSKYLNLKRDLEFGFLDKISKGEFINKSKYLNLKGGTFYKKIFE